MTTYAPTKVLRRGPLTAARRALTLGAMLLLHLAFAHTDTVLAILASQPSDCPAPGGDKGLTVFLALLGIMGTLGGALGVSVLSAKASRRERVATESRDERQAIYKRLIGMLRQGGLQQMNNVAEGADVLIYASDEVVTAWGNMINFVVYEGGAAAATTRTIELWGELLLAMRRDAGQPGSELTVDGAMRALGIDRTRDWKERVDKANAPDQKAPPHPDEPTK